MKEKIEKYGLIGVLAVVALGMGVIKIKYRNVDWGAESKKTATITPIRASQNNEDYPLWKLLPYKGNGFVVERYAEPLVLVVKSEKSSHQTEIEEIYKWMKENKVATESHKLVFEKK